MKTRSLTKQDVATEPHRLWNSFVDLLAAEDYRELSPEQQPAHLVFWYESEIQNGGHLQYFENRGTERLAETIAALGSLGAPCHQQVLREAGALWHERTRPHIQSAQEFHDTALDGEFERFDARFHLCTPTLQTCLEAHLRDHEASFVRVI
jgi:hypothetical protein